MNKFVVRSVILIALVLVAFLAGRWFERAANGYHFAVREEKSIDSPVGPIHWQYVTESLGAPLLDPGTTQIEVDGRYIYRAKRAFQGNVPFAHNVRANSTGQVEWDDGEYAFTLTMQKQSPASTTTTPSR